jgi:Enoyl-CoA hydratase/isomerase
MSDYEHLIYEQRGPVTVITINRPERMNAIGPQTHRELVDAWDRFRADDTALVGVLTGAGDKAFCAGGDLKAAMASSRQNVKAGWAKSRACRSATAASKTNWPSSTQRSNERQPPPNSACRHSPPSPESPLPHESRVRGFATRYSQHHRS